MDNMLRAVKTADFVKTWSLSEGEFTFRLKGQCHEIFDPHFFSLIQPIWVPDFQAKVISNINSISPRYLYQKLTLRMRIYAESKKKLKEFQFKNSF